MRTTEVRGRKAEQIKRFIGDFEVRLRFLFFGLWSSKNGKTASDYKAESLIVKLMRKLNQDKLQFGATLAIINSLECGGLAPLWSDARNHGLY